MLQIIFLAEQYDAQIANLEFNSINQLYGQSAGVFTDDTRVAIYGMGPLLGGEIISASLFFKTDSSNEMILLFYGGVFGVSKSKDELLLTLKDGNPTLYLDRRKYLTTKGDFHLDDGIWHSIAISMPSKSCLSSEIEIYVNGLKVETVYAGKNDHVFFTTSGKLSLGGWGYSNHNYESQYPEVSPFNGMMDNFFLWAGSSMDSEMLRKANLKRFEYNRKATCLSSPNKQRIGNKIISPKRCRKLCMKNPACWGYQVRKRSGSNHFRCHIWIGERPEVINSGIKSDRCNPVVK